MKKYLAIVLLLFSLVLTACGGASPKTAGRELTEVDGLPEFYTEEPREVAKWDYYDTSLMRYGQFKGGWLFEDGRKIAFYLVTVAAGNRYYDICVDDGEGWYIFNSSVVNNEGRELWYDGVPSVGQFDGILFSTEKLGVIYDHGQFLSDRQAFYTRDGGLTWSPCFLDEDEYKKFTGEDFYMDGFRLDAAVEGENIRLTATGTVDGESRTREILLTPTGMTYLWPNN